MTTFCRNCALPIEQYRNEVWVHTETLERACWLLMATPTHQVNATTGGTITTKQDEMGTTGPNHD